jgi:hypothetical protein
MFFIYIVYICGGVVSLYYMLCTLVFVDIDIDIRQVVYVQRIRCSKNSPWKHQLYISPEDGP